MYINLGTTMYYERETCWVRWTDVGVVRLDGWAYILRSL